MRITLGRLRMGLGSRSATIRVRVPRGAMAREQAALAPLARPRGLWGVLRLAWASARAAWRMARTMKGAGQ